MSKRSIFFLLGSFGSYKKTQDHHKKYQLIIRIRVQLKSELNLLSISERRNSSTLPTQRIQGSKSSPGIEEQQENQNSEKFS
jgi:hypothetical protein